VAPFPRTLYAFVIDGNVKYVRKTTKTLKGRMDNYSASDWTGLPATKRSSDMYFENDTKGG